MGNSDHGTSYTRVGGGDGELRPWHCIYATGNPNVLLVNPLPCPPHHLGHPYPSPTGGRRRILNPSGKCSCVRPTRGTACGTMRSMCGADADCLAIYYQSLSHRRCLHWQRRCRCCRGDRGQELITGVPRSRDCKGASLK